MKILICNTSRSLCGGVENIVADLARRLPKYGIDTVVGLTKGFRHNLPERYRAAFPDIPCVDMDGTGGTWQARLEGVLASIRTVRPDIVLIVRVYDAYEAAAILKRAAVPLRLAVTIQAYEPHYLYDARLYRDYIDLCVTSGEMVRHGVCTWSGVPQERVVSIPGGVAVPIVKVAPRMPATPLRIGYVGRMDPDQKRILDLLPFLRLLEARALPFLFTIAGTGPAEERLRRELLPMIEAGKVQFLGWQSTETLYRQVYPNLDVLVHFAHTEGVTIAPREAMVHGVVPVVSEFIGLRRERQFLHGINALTFPVGDVGAAVERVLRLANEPGLLSRLSLAAMQSQQGKYEAEGAIKAWAEAFRRCMEKPPTIGDFVKPRHIPDGRLARWGINDWLAQRFRDALGTKHLHTDGGGEWPTGSGLMTVEAEREIMALVADDD